MAPVVVLHGLTCFESCGIFPDQGSNSGPLHWQATSYPLGHQGSPGIFYFILFLIFIAKIFRQVKGWRDIFIDQKIWRNQHVLGAYPPPSDCAREQTGQIPRKLSEYLSENSCHGSPGTHCVWREVSEQRLVSCPGLPGSPQWAGGENTEVLLLAWLSGGLAEPRLHPNSVGPQVLTVLPGALSPSSLKGGKEFATNVLKLFQTTEPFLQSKCYMELNMYVVGHLF